MPYTVPSTVTGIIFTIASSAFNDGEPYYRIVRNVIAPKLTPRVGALEDDVDRIEDDVDRIEDDVADLTDRVDDLEGTSQITTTWTSGYYVNNVQHALSPLSGFNYSALIELVKGESIQIYDGYTNTATVVDMISEWDSTGNTYIASIYPYSVADQYSNSTKYTATKAKEYIRVCFYNYNSEVISKIKIMKTNAKFNPDIIVDVDYLMGLSIIPSVSMFERVGFCGDSYVKGQLYDGSGVVGDFPELSWGSNIGRMYGITADIFASGGADTNTFQSRQDCLPALLASQNPCGLYVFCMGINDSTYVTTGTITDITGYQDWHNYPNTFYGNYGKIVEQVLSYSPDSKIIIMTPCHPRYIEDYVTPVEEIAEHYGIAMINTSDSKLITSTDFTTMLVGAHPTAALASAMARDIANLIGKCIKSYYSYFKDYYGVTAS